MLKSYDLNGNLVDKVQIAIQRLKNFEPPDGYFVAFSGGKDSQCIYHLCEIAGVKFDAHYSVTSVDPPSLVKFVRNQYPNVHFGIPHDENGKPITMWNLIPKKLMPPTRKSRYCCEILKESSGKGRVTVTGVRWAESTNRTTNQDIVNIQNGTKKAKEVAEKVDAKYRQSPRGGLLLNDDNDPSRRMVEHCYRTHKTLVNPIVDWSEEDVWEFLNDVAKVPHCHLYDEGYKRLGCIGCPLSYNAEFELNVNPAFKNAYLRAFGRLIEERIQRGLETTWDTPQDVMKWWLDRNKRDRELEGQLSLFDMENEE